VIAFVLLQAARAAQAQDEPRWALVIGNNDYRHARKLEAAVNDARDMAAALRRLGFSVLAHENLDRAGMYEAVDGFADRVLDGIALVYYAGHGVRIGSDNYLLPVDNEVRNERDVENHALPLDRMIRQLAGAKARLVVVLVDACRDNPLPPAPTRTRSGQAPGGLGRPETPKGTLIVYAAGENQRALDQVPGEPEPHGLFVRELLPELDRPGVPLDQAIRNARKRISKRAREAGHEQNPAIYDELEGGDFYLVPPTTARAEEDTVPAGRPPYAGADETAFRAIRDSTRPKDFELFLERFPQSPLATFARSRLEALTDDKVAALPPEPSPAVPAPGRRSGLPAAIRSPAEVEAALGLGPGDWDDVRQALLTLGIDTAGEGGMPGPATRQGIADWQASFLPQSKVTGYLDGPLRNVLLSMSSSLDPQQRATNVLKVITKRENLLGDKLKKLEAVARNIHERRLSSAHDEAKYPALLGKFYGGINLPDELVDDWIVEHTAMGAGSSYTLRADGTYDYKIFNLAAGRRQVISSEAGIYSVEGDRLTLNPQGGLPKTYKWRITRDPYITIKESRILLLTGDGGTEETFYGSR
jgi:hypothetical protein